MAGPDPKPQRAADVVEAIGRSSSADVGPVRAQLMDVDLLYTIQHGLAAFTVPHFDQFMLWVVPDLVVPTPPRRSRESAE